MKKIIFVLALVVSLPTWSDVFTVSGDDDSGALLARVKFTLELKDGITKRTKNKRFTHLTVARVGRRQERSFSAWCGLSGKVSVQEQVDTVGCSLYEETVSNDDDEELSLSFLRKHNVGVREPEFLLKLGYMGDGTILADELEVLFGDEYDLEQIDGLDRGVALEGNLGENPEKDSFELLAHVGNSLRNLIGRSVYSEDLETVVKVRAVEYSVSEKMDVGLTLRVGRDASHGVNVESRVSLLSDPRDLSKGLASSKTISERALAALPKK